MKALIVARLTLHEATRRRLLLAVLVLTLLSVALTSWGFSKLDGATGANGQPLPRGELLIDQATLVILIAYMFSVVLAVGAAFLAAPSIGGDVESGALLAILPRPLRRSDVVVGKWLGLATLLIGYAAVSSGLEFAAFRLVGGYVAPHPVQAVGYLAGQSLVIMTLALLASTRLAPITGGIVAIMLWGIAWVAGIAGVIGAVLANGAITMATTVIGLILPTDCLWRGAMFNLEPPILVTLSQSEGHASPFAVAAGPAPANALWAIVWTAAILVLAAVSFARRDL